MPVDGNGKEDVFLRDRAIDGESFRYTAEVLTPGTSVTGSIDGGKAAQWYEFDVNEMGSTLTASLSGLSLKE